MAKINRKKSKRVSCRQRYKIIKKVAEHRRKLKKEAKKNPKSKRTPKDPGVPNSHPFKEDILREAEQRKQRALDLKAAQKESRLKLQMGNRALSEMAEEANRNDEAFEDVPHSKEENELKENAPNFKTYFKELKNVVENSDIILEVLDARDPLGSRCPQIEELVVGSGKKLVLVLNKIDLIPRQNLNDWLTYLRKSLPTVAFKASTQSQATNLSRSKIPAVKLNESLQSSSPCFGASFLMKILGNYCRNQNIQTFIKVGVVGFPNVGKSSVINSLKRCRACNVGSTPGLTKAVQEISLDKHIKILDSPGVVLARSDSSANLALRNAVKVETLKDVIMPAEEIIKRVDHQQLCLHYTIPQFSSSQELFCLLAKRMGRYKKGGIPNEEEGARRLINDWNRGIIKYYTHPPEEEQKSPYLSTTIVSEFSKAFDISALEEKMELDKAPELFPSHGVLARSSGTTSVDISANDEEEMELEKPEKKVTVKFDKKKDKKSADSEIRLIGEDEQQNKLVKKKFKQMKKNRKRVNKAASALSDTLVSALTL